MRVYLALTALAVACSDNPNSCPDRSGNEAEAVDMAEALCDEQAHRCTPQQDIRIAWTNGITVYYSPVRCAENLPLCRFVLWHEFGHVQRGDDDEREADCFAAKQADDAAVDAALCFFATTATPSNEGHGTSDQRHADIWDCATIGYMRNPPPPDPRGPLAN